MREALVRQLHRYEFPDGAENVVLIDGAGTGKNPVRPARRTKPIYELVIKYIFSYY
jgi:hypothetical protein